MFSILKNRFGIPGVIAVMALVLAMIGGAYAASGGLTATQKKQVKAIAKSFQGTGPAGPAGATGSQGSAGANGKNGTAGPTGPEGSPWTAGGTLPSGATETGAYRSTSAAGAVIEFNIPLPEELDAAHQKVVTKEQIENEEVPAECENEENPGAASAANPEAAPGYLCVFAASAGKPGGAVKLTTDIEEGLQVGAGKTGANLVIFTGGPAAGIGNGTWAVTALARPPPH